MNRKLIAIIGYSLIALVGAVILIAGILSFKSQVGSSALMVISGIIFLLIGIRGPIQFLKKEKRSKERFQDKNS